MADNTPLIEMTGVSAAFGRHTVFENLTFRVNRGEFILLHGGTGSGKSTVLKLIAALIRPCAGQVYVAGDRIDQFSDAQRRWLRRSIGLLTQENLLLNDRTILENVMLPTLAANESTGEAKTRALVALDRCGIKELAASRPDALSYGQRQLVCLARAVVNRPVLILADEPVAHLDRANAESLLNLLATFARAGVTVIAASHQRINPPTENFREISLGAPHKGM